MVEALLTGPGLAESTRTDYRRVWTKLTEFDASIGSTPISDIDVVWVNRLYRRLAEHIVSAELVAQEEPVKPMRGPTRQPKPVRPKRAADQWSLHRIRRVHEVCSAAWTRQQRVGNLDGNPFTAAGKPSVDRPQPQFPTTADIAQLLATAERLASEWLTDRRRNPAAARQLVLYARLLAMTGARKGELVALRWRHVHLDRQPPTIDIIESLSYGSAGGNKDAFRKGRRGLLGAGIVIRGTKTGSSGHRTISIDAATATLLQTVLDRRSTQPDDRFVLSVADDGVRRSR